MKNVIDLTPYLPQKQAAAIHPLLRKRFKNAVAVVENAITLCIGAAFFLIIIAFLAAL